MVKIKSTNGLRAKTLPLSDVETGHVFKFYALDGKHVKEPPMLRLSRGCGYAELGAAFDSVEQLDCKQIEKNTKKVKVFGKIKAIEVQND